MKLFTLFISYDALLIIIYYRFYKLIKLYIKIFKYTLFLYQLQTVYF